MADASSFFGQHGGPRGQEEEEANGDAPQTCLRRVAPDSWQPAYRGRPPRGRFHAGAWCSGGIGGRCNLLDAVLVKAFHAILVSRNGGGRSGKFYHFKTRSGKLTERRKTRQKLQVWALGFAQIRVSSVRKRNMPK